MANVYLASHTLQFAFPAGTSRGVLHQHGVEYLRLESEGAVGLGEAAPLLGLSPESREDARSALQTAARYLAEATNWPTDTKQVFALAQQLSGGMSSVAFALETALLSWCNHRLLGQQHRVFNCPFSQGQASLPTNGLIWMGDKQEMLDRIRQKLDAGFSCLKMKIGALGVENELEILRQIRQNYPARTLSLRVDANGAFDKTSVWSVLDRLAKLEVHSIEQPVAAGNYDLMRELCHQSPVPIGLDEELIRPPASSERKRWLEYLSPQYLILKPSLHGGLSGATSWIALADSLGIGWWLTSALESNVGLNAIAQFAGIHAINLPQGLGTGQLYTNNIPSPLELVGESLRYNPQGVWNWDGLSFIAV